MLPSRCRAFVLPALAVWAGACSGTGAVLDGSDGSAAAPVDASSPRGVDSSADGNRALDAGDAPDTGTARDLAARPDLADPVDLSAGPDLEAPGGDTLGANRDRLLATYLDFLKANAATPQTNGLSAANVASVCDVWSRLDASSRDVFLTLTARLQGSLLGEDGSSMLSHVTRLYRVVGGQGAGTGNAGSCGGGEYNRMILSMDAELHDAQLAANLHQGARQSNGDYDIADIPSTSFWRASHDLAGPHSPFDESDETNQGAPRGQTQYFKDPGSQQANAPLGRTDLEGLVDPHALEMDQDYDCIHNSNPDCVYVTYGPLCLPETPLVGTAVYAESYGSLDAGWTPTGCAP